MKRILKISWLCFWGTFFTSILFLPILCAALMSKTGNLAFTFSKLWAKGMLVISGVKVSIKGKYLINPQNKYIICANHQSHFDIIALVTSLGIQFRWIIKKELRKIPLFGTALYYSKNVFIDRSNKNNALKKIEKEVKTLPNGVSLMIFPEGTRSLNGDILPFKKGAFRIAAFYSITILPITINGSRKIQKKGSLEFFPGKIEIIVNNPIDVENYEHDNLTFLLDQTKMAIMKSFKPSFSN